MTRRVRILTAAAEEVAEAAVRYEKQMPGLGEEFANAVEAALDLLEQDIVPLSRVPGIAGERGAMRLVLRRFPYDIAVRILGDEIIVLAFAHQSRSPGYWRFRASRNP